MRHIDYHQRLQRIAAEVYFNRIRQIRQIQFICKKVVAEVETCQTIVIFQRECSEFIPGEIQLADMRGGWQVKLRQCVIACVYIHQHILFVITVDAFKIQRCQFIAANVNRL